MVSFFHVVDVQFVSELCQDGPWNITITMRGPNKSVQVLGTLEGKGKRKMAPAFQSSCKSIRRTHAFLEEKDADVSEPVGSQNSPVTGGHMCRGEWVTDSRVEPPDDFRCHDGDIFRCPQTVPQCGDDWDDTQVVEDDCV